MCIRDSLRRDHLGRVHAVLVAVAGRADPDRVMDLDEPQRAEEGVPVSRERHIAALAGPRGPADVPHRDGERRVVVPLSHDRREGHAEEREADHAEGDLGPTEPPHDAGPCHAARFVRMRSPKAPPRDKRPRAAKSGIWLAVAGSCLSGRASATTTGGAGSAYGFTCRSGVTTAMGTDLYSASFTSSGIAITGSLATAASSMARRFG